MIKAPENVLTCWLPNVIYIGMKYFQYLLLQSWSSCVLRVGEYGLLSSIVSRVTLKLCENVSNSIIHWLKDL